MKCLFNNGIAWVDKAIEYDSRRSGDTIDLWLMLPHLCRDSRLIRLMSNGFPPDLIDHDAQGWVYIVIFLSTELQ
jgi:hypothetical protein